MNNVMIDLETLSTKPNAAIVSIGAVFFDPKHGELGETYYQTIDIETYGECSGFDIDGSTLKWWMQQSDQARAVFSGTMQCDLQPVLRGFHAFLESHGSTADLKVWGNGAAFDNVILANAYQSTGWAAPWKFWNDRCYRTVKALNPQIPFTREGVYHNALDDAVSQAKHLCQIFESLRGKA